MSEYHSIDSDLDFLIRLVATFKIERPSPHYLRDIARIAERTADRIEAELVEAASWETAERLGLSR